MTSGARGREAAASAAQYVLLGGFAGVAAGISAQGLTGFARDNMGLHGAWPYLLFLALDGAAGVCAVLLTRRAARADSGLAPRLAVWGLVAASASFNVTHAPRRPAAPEAFGLMPVIAAILFEFTLRELQLRAGRADRRLAALRWLHPAERVRVQLRLAADDDISAEAATRRVRIDLAARRLYQLRRALLAQGRAARPGGMAARRARLAEHRAHAALIRAGFADQAIAAQVLRQVQVLTRTRDLARLDYTTAGAAQAAIASLITSGAPVTPPGPLVMPARPATPGRLQDGTSRSPASGINGTAAGQVSRTGQPGPALPPPAPAAARRAGGQRRGSCQPAPGAGRPAHGRCRPHRHRREAARRAAQPEGARRPAPPRRPPCRQPRPAVAAGRGHRPRRRRPAAGRPVMPPHLPGQAREPEEDRQRTLRALRARLHDDAQALRTPGDWAACLGLATRLPGEDFANILLIHAQRPGATVVRDYQQWIAAGRQVRKGEHGIAIFASPSRPRAQRQDHDRDEPGPSWREAGRVTYAWDLSQTTGPPVSDDAARPSRDPPAGVRDALCWLARREGYAVELEHGPPSDGTVFWAARRIRIPPGLSGEQAVWALAHQLGHVLLHHDPGYPPGATTSGCAGVRKAEADSVAWITCARHGITPAGGLPYPASWAGTDPRAQPAAAILTAGHRITTAATRITRHTSRILHGDPAPVLPARPRPATQATHPGTGQQGTATPQAGTPVTQPAASPAPEPDGAIRRVLADAHAFYTGQLAGSWAPGYLQARGITAAAIQDWHIGYAPAGWTALTEHLRRLGHHDDAIQAAGLAIRSSRGTLIDRFRDRIMLPVHDAAGLLAGFTGRARPGAGPDTPKYLNSPETATYHKSHLLFGLYQARPDLARGAIPVIVEGAFDAIAVSIADPGRHAGLAPCGTALTSQQAAQLSQAADLLRTGILVAFDSDTAGRKAAIRAHGILRPLTGRLQSAALDGKDPAEILQRDGPAALRIILREHRQSLSALLIDASIEQWGRRLDDTSGPLLAMRSTASLIASLLPDDTASQIRDITAGRELQTTDDLLRPVDNPEIPQIARILPADTSYQIVRAAGKLGFDCTDILTEVTNATTRNTGSAGHQPRAPHNDQGRSPAAPKPSAARLARSYGVSGQESRA